MTAKTKRTKDIPLPLDASIPERYIPDRNIRLQLYRRLATIRTLEEVETLGQEFHDRFGAPHGASSGTNASVTSGKASGGTNG